MCRYVNEMFFAVIVFSIEKELVLCSCVYILQTKITYELNQNAQIV